MSNKIEILGAGNLQQAFAELGIEANNTYKGGVGPKYEVWELSAENFKLLESVLEEKWKDEWGGWRYSEGTNVDYSPVAEALINGESCLVWVNVDKEEYYGNEDDASIPLEFESISHYMINMWGVSQPRNVCALAVGLAKLNGISMAGLFRKYEGD